MSKEEKQEKNYNLVSISVTVSVSIIVLSCKKKKINLRGTMKCNWDVEGKEKLGLSNDSLHP